MSFGYSTKRGNAAKRLLNTSAVVRPWIRDPSWLALPAVASNDAKFVGLHKVHPDSNFLALSAAAAYTVDWGDGSATVNYATGVIAYKQYDFAAAGLDNTNGPVTLTDAGDLVTRTAHGHSDGSIAKFYNIVSTTGLTEANLYYVINSTANTFQVSATVGGAAVALTTDGSATLLPYKQAIVIVTPQGANSTFTTLNLHKKHNQTGVSAYTSGFVDIVIAGSSLTSILIAVATAGNSTQTIKYNALEQVSILSSDITSASLLLYNCSNLRNVVGFSSSALTSTNSMFRGCWSLTTVPLFNTASVTNMSAMFQNCTSLVTIPLFNTVSCTLINTMFYWCFSLQEVPLLNTALVTNFNLMFYLCTSLESVPLLNTASATNMSQMFANCYALVTVPLFNTAAVTNMSSMFISCYSLTSVPLFNTAAVTNMSSMFSSCYSLTSVPLFNTAAVTNMSSMFSGCVALTTVPLFNATAMTVATTMFATCTNLSIGTLSGTKYAISYTGCKLSETELTSIIDNLGTANTQGLILTISSNWGATTPVSITGTTTVGSTTITTASTTGVVVGMQWTGTGSPATTALACTFSGADLVIATAHGLSDDDPVSFATIVTTTGIVINTIYYVVNAAANRFNIALTVGGDPIIQTGGAGSGTMRYLSTVSSFVANTSITVSRKATASGTSSALSFRTLKTQTALLKGWAVTG